MSNELSPTHKLAEYVCVFLDKRLSPNTIFTIKANLVQEILHYRKVILEEFCEKNNICMTCGNKRDLNHNEECWDNK